MTIEEAARAFDLIRERLGDEDVPLNVAADIDQIIFEVTEAEDRDR